MKFLETNSQEAIRKEFRGWLSLHLPEEWKHVGKSVRPPTDADTVIHRSWERIMFEHGWAGLHWPMEYGGRGLSLREHLVIQEELGLCGAPEGINGMGRELVGPILLQVGTDAQKVRYLRNILNGTEVWCQGFSEPNAGSDLGALKTSAKSEGNYWRINGQKVWTSYAENADLCLLLARVERVDNARGAIAMFIMPMHSEGVTVRPIEQINGKREFCEVFLDDVQIPGSALVGTLDAGWKSASQVLSVERGINKLYRQASFVSELRAIAQLIEGPETLLCRSEFRRRASVLYGKLNTLRYRNFGLINRLISGEHLGNATSTHKLYWTELHQEICELGLEVIESLPEDRLSDHEAAGRVLYAYLSSRAETIFAGTSQIQRDIIARHVLKLPESIK